MNPIKEGDSWFMWDQKDKKGSKENCEDFY